MKIRLMALLALLGLLLTAGSVAQANPIEQTTALTRARIVSGSASGSDFGDTFSKVQSVGIGPGYRAVNVQLSGWSLQYASEDHHIRTAAVRISNVQYNASTGNVTFTISGTYRDKNGDDDFNWAVYYTILALG